MHTPRAWPAPPSCDLSLSPAWLCRPCVTEDESQASATRPAVSPRCAACTAFPLSQICPAWTRASWRPLSVTLAVFSLPLSLPPCTRASSSRGAGTQTAHLSVLPLHHLCQSWDPSSSAAVVALCPSHRLQRLSPKLRRNLISVTNSRASLPRSLARSEVAVRGSCRAARLCCTISASQLWTEKQRPRRCGGRGAELRRLPDVQQLLRAESCWMWSCSRTGGSRVPSSSSSSSFMLLLQQS